jgi:hypothetical protein
MREVRRNDSPFLKGVRGILSVTHQNTLSLYLLFPEKIPLNPPLKRGNFDGAKVLLTQYKNYD